MTFGRPASISPSHPQPKLPRDIDLDVLCAQGHENIDRGPVNSPEHGPEQSTSTVLLFTYSMYVTRRLRLVEDADEESKLYMIVGDIIDRVYGNNYTSDATSTQAKRSSDLFQSIMSLESQLTTWKSTLPLRLRIQTKEDIPTNAQEPSAVSAMGTVITLRYMHTRMLLHRPMIARFLSYDRKVSSNEQEWNFLKDFGRVSLEVGVRAAAGMIDFIHSATEGPCLMLTSWWFSLYYLFSSSLVVFAALIITHKSGIRASHCVPQDMVTKLKTALDVLENFGDDTRIARRCRKYLHKLIDVASIITLQGFETPTRSGIVNLVQNNGTTLHTASNNNQRTRRGSAEAIVTLASDISDLSPWGMDSGLFLSHDDWNTFTQSMQHDDMGFSFQDG
ncbi:hypothetical protein LTR49_025576 [Elasticomyces elasticus]|nr:hypothetical protein LTR49_025576 [Elasticomyces elasticus]